jgi:AcrR family transcriptional regulator
MPAPGLPRQALYRHYPSRDHLLAVLAVLVDRVVRGFDAHLAQIFDEVLEAEDAFVGNQKGMSSAFEEADQVVEAVQHFSCQHHSTMEPMNAAAVWTEDGCEVWTATQNAEAALALASEAADLPIEACDIHRVQLGGEFGRRATSQDFVRQAVQIAQQMPGTPAKLIWSREEDQAQGSMTRSPSRSCAVRSTPRATSSGSTCGSPASRSSRRCGPRGFRRGETPPAPQRVGAIAEVAGVADATGWCPIVPETFESQLVPGIHAIGDACFAGAMLKSAFSANAKAKVCAVTIGTLFRGEPPPAPKLINACCSLCAPTTGSPWPASVSRRTACWPTSRARAERARSRPTRRSAGSRRTTPARGSRRSRRRGSDGCRPSSPRRSSSPGRPRPSPVLETDLVTTAFSAISRARFGNRRRPERLFPLNGGGPTMDSTHGREEELRELARRLYFRVERTGDRFSICREAGVEQPVRHDGLTLDEAEEVLNKWKLRGFHGG